jgi:hypothetical protein
MDKTVDYPFLLPEFLAAMNDIGRYGHEKYKEESFHARAQSGDHSRGSLHRNDPDCIAAHAKGHFDEYLKGVKHDKFNTQIHQLAAVAFNAMLEAYYACLTRAEGNSDWHAA